MVACMQFINIIVHSVEDFNFRVALQWEFAALGLRECLEKLRTHESDELAVQISGKKNPINKIKIFDFFRSVESIILDICKS